MTVLSTGARSAVLCAFLLAGCSDDGTTSLGDDLTDPQLPARGKDDLTKWLASGYYKSWTCEASPRAMGAHGPSRVCNNDALHAASASAPFPVGAASVKELYSGGKIIGYAVSRKLEEGTTGNLWYWYEDSAGSIHADGQDAPSCIGCHGQAPRDFVYTIVP